MIVYAKNSGMTTALGKIDTPIKMIIRERTEK
jgi:hypothetical protein